MNFYAGLFNAMYKTFREIPNLSDFEPLQLDVCTTVFDLKLFFESHSSIVANYEANGSHRVAQPYKKRGILALKLINEICQKKKEEKNDQDNP